MTLYNFGIFIANEAAKENKKKERKNDNKYLYEIDISSALKTARKFFIRMDPDKPMDWIHQAVMKDLILWHVFEL